MQQFIVKSKENAKAPSTIAFKDLTTLPIVDISKANSTVTKVRHEKLLETQKTRDLETE